MIALRSLLMQGFSHGIHPRDHKERTAALPTQRMPFVDRYVLPLSQSLGAPARPLVGGRAARTEQHPDVVLDNAARLI